MKIDRNSNGEYKLAIFFQWIFETKEYSADAFNYDIFEETKEIDTMFTYTDVSNLENIVHDLTTYSCLDVDMFETVVLKDAFLATLKVLILEGKIPEDKIQHLKDWYFSETPKYKILENDEEAWKKWVG